MNIIEKIFGTHSENELKRIYPIVDRIEALGPEMEALSDEDCWSCCWVVRCCLCR